MGLGKPIAISVSDPDDADLENFGVSSSHVKHTFVELARQLLASGEDLAYGGDLRQGGYTETLRALLRTYSQAERPGDKRIVNYLAPSAWYEIDHEDLADLSTVMTLVRVEDPKPVNLVQRAQGLRNMREQMADETSVRIVVGGRLFGQQGRWPGIIEEAYLSAERRQPVFILGGLGGAASRLANAVSGDWPRELTDEFQVESSEGVGELMEAEIGPSENDLRERLYELPPNGLEEEENLALLRTADLDLMVALVLRGIRELAGGQLVH